VTAPAPFRHPGLDPASTFLVGASERKWMPDRVRHDEKNCRESSFLHPRLHASFPRMAPRLAPNSSHSLSAERHFDLKNAGLLATLNFLNFVYFRGVA
jgi:hypothetical protein